MRPSNQALGTSLEEITEGRWSCLRSLQSVAAPAPGQRGRWLYVSSLVFRHGDGQALLASMARVLAIRALAPETVATATPLARCFYLCYHQFRAKSVGWEEAIKSWPILLDFRLL